MENLNEFLSNQDNLNNVKSFLSEQGYSIRNQDDESNFLKKYEDEKIAPRVREVGDRVETDMSEHWGVSKESGEKYYDLVKRGGKLYKDALGQIQSLQSQLEEIKAGAKPNDIDKKTISELQQQLESQKLKFSEERKGWEESENKRNKLSFIEKNLNINSSLPEDVLKVVKETAMNHLLSLENEWRDNNLAFLKEGSAIYDSENRLAGPDYLLKEKYPSLYDASQKKETSLGITDVKTNGSNQLSVSIKEAPMDLKNQGELHRFLKKSGLSMSDKDYQSTFDKIVEERKLPPR